MDTENALDLLRAAAGALADRLPDDCRWSRTSWSRVDPDALRHVYSDDWASLSRGTGRLTESAARIREGAPGAVADRVRRIAARFDPAQCGSLFLGANWPGGPYVVLDGNHRATASLVCRPAGLESWPVYIATSNSAPIWNWEQPRGMD